MPPSSSSLSPPLASIPLRIFLTMLDSPIIPYSSNLYSQWFTVTLELHATTWVKWVNNLAQGPTCNSVTLNRTHQDDLGGPNGQDALGMDQTGVSQVIKPTFAKDLGSGLEPYGLTELDTIAGQELREDTSKSSKHGPSAVDHLKLARCPTRSHLGTHRSGMMGLHRRMGLGTSHAQDRTMDFLMVQPSWQLQSSSLKLFHFRRAENLWEMFSLLVRRMEMKEPCWKQPLNIFSN
ncbi:hypothetical protein LXL04_002489 [Taraxacum kok-saghyz]